MSLTFFRFSFFFLFVFVFVVFVVVVVVDRATLKRISDGNRSRSSIESTEKILPPCRLTKSLTKCFAYLEKTIFDRTIYLRCLFRRKRKVNFDVNFSTSNDFLYNLAHANHQQSNVQMVFDELALWRFI